MMLAKIEKHVANAPRLHRSPELKEVNVSSLFLWEKIKIDPEKTGPPIESAEQLFPMETFLFLAEKTSKSDF
jgi:hypothetical protein